MKAVTRRRRVLIVEADPDVAARVEARALELGLDPVLCEGPRVRGGCPVLEGHECTRNERCAAVLVSIDGDVQAQVAPGCAGDAPLIVARPRFGTPARLVVADKHLSNPYDADYAALALFALADSEIEPRKRSVGGIAHVVV